MDSTLLILLALTGIGAYALGPIGVVWLGAYQLRAGHLKRTMWLINQAVRFYWKPTHALVFRATILMYYFSDHAGAITDTNRAIKMDSNFADAFNKRSYAHYRLGEIDKAMKDLDKALDLQSDLLEVYTRRAQILIEWYQDFDAATDEYEQALQYEPKNVELYYLMVQNYICKRLCSSVESLPTCRKEWY